MADTAQHKIAVVTDSACDLPDEVLKQHNVSFISLRMVYPTCEYRDRVEITPDQVYDNLKEILPKTSLPFPEDVTNLYDKLRQEGYTHVIHICISSGLSGTYNMVRMIAEGYQGLTIEVIDSRILSMGLGYMVLECVKALNETGSFSAAVAHTKAVREGILGCFVIRTLEYLRKGGRIGLVEGMLGSMLNLKPVIFVNDDGIYQTLTKARGNNNALDAMLREVCSKFQQQKIHLAVVYGAAREEAEKLLIRAKSLLNVAESMICQVSPVLGAHTGPSLLGIVAHAV